MDLLTKADCEVILEALRYSKRAVGDSGENLATRAETIERIEAAERKVRAIQGSASP
jgi:hypothetical protein